MQVGLFRFSLVIRPFFFLSRPERWANIQNAVSSIPGVRVNLLTLFIEELDFVISFRFLLVE